MLTVPVGKTKVKITRNVSSEEWNHSLHEGDIGYIDKYFEHSVIFVRLSDGVFSKLRPTTLLNL